MKSCVTYTGVPQWCFLQSLRGKVSLTARLAKLVALPNILQVRPICLSNLIHDLLESQLNPPYTVFRLYLCGMWKHCIVCDIVMYVWDSQLSVSQYLFA